MKFILEVNNQTKQKISRKEILDTFKRTISLAKITCLDEKDLELSVASVEESEIQDLNTRYRQKKKPTDVLSFSEYENTVKLCAEKNQQVFIGELILCPAVIQKNAVEDGESFDYAYTYIIAHGILHLLGLDHGKKMFDLQRAVADELIKQK
jgi:probable rRNA maturation factor